MGNLTYALGILIKSRSWADILASLPFLVGSIGTVVFDFIILAQFEFYKLKGASSARNSNLGERERKLTDADGMPREFPRGLHNIVHWRSPEAPRSPAHRLAALDGSSDGLPHTLARLENKHANVQRQWSM
jgi:hypothetical protein